ncbi:MAG: hypothetical protein HRU38_05065 [Saccharospirillaceae bacterium]|nr:hypothetical protein [Pseudomonadales bacterium]NRB78027.1 hypothetical protein [Saccharospirillaceae bacterium]
MANNNDLNTLDILCALDKTLSDNATAPFQTDIHLNLIHRATFKLSQWLLTKFNTSLSLRLIKSHYIDEETIHITLRHKTFARSLTFNFEFNQNGDLAFSKTEHFRVSLQINQHFEDHQKYVA